ncbi:MAG TPA: DUF4215 domain-containing protein, partial [Candidatus Peribacteria bacterium]|nr:DUF4215 domain-containing protein [Candidatus Peribacteria bacterium]
MENAVPTQSKLKGFLRRPAFLIGLGACAVASTFVFLTVSGQGPKVSHSTIPIPFIPGENHGAAAAGNGLAGSVTYVRTLANGVEFYEMDFVGDSSQLAPADKVYLVKVPTGVTSIPFERVVLDSNGATRPYYGYIYTSSSAATEIANQSATGFAVRFPGLFFASAAVKAAHGTDLDAFASINGITFKTSTQFDTGSGARLRGPQLIALVPTDQNLLIDIAPVCGNSWKAATEDCDDGNVDNGDGCSSTCTIESGFTCDATSEQSVCTPAPVCGDGFKTQGETCDDGNTDAGDGCSATCAAEAGFTCDASEPSLCIRTCGNGVRGAGETCDDGNTDSGDGCSATCAVENGFTCDTASPNVCDSTASAVCGNSLREGDTCGNAYVDNNEECDYAIECEGVPDGGTCACHADCTICDGNESCVFHPPAYNGETCDDGNTDDADGCDATCDVESGFTCDTASPNVCTALPANTCGDGNLEAGETCDDGDTDGGDGCSALCAVENGFTCDGDSPTICTPDPVCGDGTKDNGEACDDGNVTAADGCSATCTV